MSLAPLRKLLGLFLVLAINFTMMRIEIPEPVVAIAAASAAYSASFLGASPEATARAVHATICNIKHFQTNFDLQAEAPASPDKSSSTATPATSPSTTLQNDCDGSGDADPPLRQLPLF